jgi:hypothetical protein
MTSFDKIYLAQFINNLVKFKIFMKYKNDKKMPKK